MVRHKPRLWVTPPADCLHCGVLPSNQGLALPKNGYLCRANPDRAGHAVTAAESVYTTLIMICFACSDGHVAHAHATKPNVGPAATHSWQVQFEVTASCVVSDCMNLYTFFESQLCDHQHTVHC